MQPDEVQRLRAELDRWSQAGQQATLWWRDDDAVEPTAALDRMIGLVERHRVPLGLAVIPLHATTALADRLRTVQLVDVLQHGYQHKNHARAGERAAEFGAQRPVTERLAEIDDGWRRLQGFARRVPIFVPPWNRYADDLGPGLAARGFAAVSAFAERKPLPGGLVECNCHVDIISWRTTRGFAGTAKTMAKLVETLEARRTGRMPRHHATGLLTHHLVHDEPSWTFLDDLFAELGQHAAVKWLRPAEAAGAMEMP